MSTLRVGRRRSAILPTLVIVAILIVVFAIFTSLWTDRLWYGSFGYASVFSKMLLTRIGLFVSFGLIMATLVVANAAIAYRLRPRLGAQVPTSPLLERYREMLESRFVWVLVAMGVVIGLFAGGAASGHVLEYLEWQNATPFNITDPTLPARHWVLRLLLSVVAVRSVVHVRCTRLQCDRGRHRPLHDGWFAVQRHTSRRKQGGAGSPLDPGRSGRAGEGF